MSADRTSHQPRSIRKVVVASLIGTSLEWYDFFLYASAAGLVFNKLFFPEADPLTGTLLAFTTSATGFVARPIGGIVFGHYGDKLGRKNVLVVTLLVMGIATFLIGLLPTYAAIGVAAPILLVALRIVQGLGLGGEWGGAVLMSACPPATCWPRPCSPSCRPSCPTPPSSPGAGGCRSCSAAC